ncbi:glutamate carboxypeptidase [Paraburkholderia sp. GAS199]|uniref:M20/M25/M40 family metallo-hydrolase n=1 Tax=Paraburkholderia sp. GAS199 TaxID=3035126 RepID=UPI003D22377F
MNQDNDLQLLSLPFDTESMIARLRAWVESESPSYDANAVNRMTALVATELGELGAHVEIIPGNGVGDSLRARLPHAHGAGAPGILVMGHLDTVHPENTLARLPWRREGGKCYGPGILDMKGGVFLAVEALRQLQRAGVTTGLPVTFLLTSDEEIGSPTTRALIEQEALRHHYILIPEPARPDGGVVTGRYAIARFNLQASGTPSHAGSRPGDGRSAIRVMAEKLIELENMTCADYTFSVGVIEGGKWVNCVPMDCRAEALSMARTQNDLDRAIERASSLGFRSDTAAFRVEVSNTRPVWNTNDATLRLYELARTEAARLGFELPRQTSGGGSDGNFTGALGLTTLDGLGPRGAGMHTLNEHIDESSLVPRARLLASLLLKLDEPSARNTQAAA